jgi:hypothetical protein
MLPEKMLDVDNKNVKSKLAHNIDLVGTSVNL